MNKIPESLLECFDALDRELDISAKNKFFNLTRDDLVATTHHTLGRWIRNNWELWSSGKLFHYMINLGFTHPDDMSATIIKEYWLKANNFPSEINSDKEKYFKHWSLFEIK